MWAPANYSVACASGLIDVDSVKNDGLKWRIAEPSPNGRVSEVFRKIKRGGVIIPDDNIT